MAAASTIYPERLDDTKGEIRLLTIRQADSGAEIECSLSKASIADSFTALSYVWGDSNDVRPIWINGILHQVTVKLESAIRHLRCTGKTGALWIDAICIRQDDVDERNAQVGMMGKIYTSAATVLVWLGEARDDSDGAMDSMPAIATGKVDDFARRKTATFYLNVVNRPWFSRVWIMQELALARDDPIIACGYKTVPWSTFMAAWKVIAQQLMEEIGQARKIESEDGKTVVEFLGLLKFDVLDDLRRATQERNGSTLRKLFLIARTSEATEPRDRLYGLLELLAQEDRQSFVVDYRKPTAQVFVEAIAHIFEKGEGPYFLSGMWLANPSPNIPALPSWVPDLTRQVAGKVTQPNSISFHPPHPFTASGAGAGADNGRLVDGTRILNVEVLVVDVIDEILLFERDLDGCKLQLPQVEVLASRARAKSLPDEELSRLLQRLRTKEPLWRTLISNKQSGYEPAPALWEGFYQKIVLRTDAESDTEAEVEEYRRFLLRLQSHLPHQAFFTTKMGFVGMGMPNVEAGDEVTIWFGAPIPFIIRRSSVDEQPCTLVGGAYVAGIMDGELVDKAYCEDLMGSTTLYVK